MSDLHDSLRLLGEAMPQRPVALDKRAIDVGRWNVIDLIPRLNAARQYALALERTLSTVAAKCAAQLEKVAALDKQCSNLRGWIAWRQDWTGDPDPRDSDGNSWYYCARRGDPAPRGYERTGIVRAMNGTGRASSGEEASK